MDRAGRLVLPRGLRARIGLMEGGEVELDIQGAAIIVELVGGGDLSREGPFTVIPRTGVSVSHADVREQRLADQR